MTTSYDSTPLELYRECSGERLLRALVAQPASTDLAWEAWGMLRFMLLDQIGEAKEQRKKSRSRKSEFYDCCSETEAKISHSVAGRLISQLHIVFDPENHRIHWSCRDRRGEFSIGADGRQPCLLSIQDEPYYTTAEAGRFLYQTLIGYAIH
jgi:hypothetical protein